MSYWHWLLLGKEQPAYFTHRQTVLLKKAPIPKELGIQRLDFIIFFLIIEEIKLCGQEVLGLRLTCLKHSL